MDKDIEKAAALALLDKGAAFHIPAPFLFRLIGKKKMRIVVRRLKLGALLYLSNIPGLDKAEAYEPKTRLQKDAAETIEHTGEKLITIPVDVIKDNLNAVCLNVSACLLNSRVKIAILKKPLARHLRWALDVDQLQELITWLFIYGRPEAFRNTIRLIQRMTVTRPMNLSQAA